MEKLNYVYITTNLINGKQYIGDHYGKLNDQYLGSGRPYLQNAFKKYGKENFKKEILQICVSKEEAFETQEKFIIKHNTLVPNGYNISPKGGLNVVGCHSEETKQKIKNSNVGKHIDERKNKSFDEIFGIEKSIEIKQKISKSHKGLKHSKEVKEKISLAKMNKPSWNKGIPQTEESKLKIKTALTGKRKGIKFSEEHKQNISNSLKGKSLSAAQKQQISTSLSNRKLSEETKLKISNSLKKRNNDKSNI